MAELGYTYLEILQFYYPGTEIGLLNEDGSVKTVDKASIVKEWALSKKGCGYVWGATGYKLTQSKLDEFYTLLSKLEKSYKNGEVTQEDYERMKKTILENYMK